MSCHDESQVRGKEASASGAGAKGRRYLGWLGLCCAGFCLVGMPLLGLVFSGMRHVGHGWVAWSVLAFSLVAFGAGLILSYRHHRDWRPALVGFAGAGLLVAKSLHGIPPWTEWIGMIALLAAWLLDQRLHRKAHRCAGASQGRFPEETRGRVLSSTGKEAGRGK
jgi:hypothetical protein